VTSGLIVEAVGFCGLFEGDVVEFPEWHHAAPGLALGGN
jgi:hypothetical protein